MPPNPTSDPSAFDAVAAAKEFDDLLGDTGTSTGGRNDTYIEGLESEIEAMTTDVASKDLELRRANKRAEQAHAEIEAATKRIATASAKELERRTNEVLAGFLFVVDDLERGIAAARKHPDPRDVVEGLELVRRSVLARLASFGVTHAPSIGERFDPKHHEALALVPVGEPSLDGRVIDVMREGYKVGDVTLRPAGVAVGRHT